MAFPPFLVSFLLLLLDPVGIGSFIQHRQSDGGDADEPPFLFRVLYQLADYQWGQRTERARPMPHRARRGVPGMMIFPVFVFVVGSFRRVSIARTGYVASAFASSGISVCSNPSMGNSLSIASIFSRPS